MRIDAAVAVVAGGASGLGRATAIELAARGAYVVVADLADFPSPGDESAITFVHADVTDPVAVGEVMGVAASLGRLRIVVNCAGIATPRRVLGHGTALDLATFRRVVDVNVAGTMNVLSRAAEIMARQSLVEGERGVIVNTASVAAYDGQVGQAAYAASKAAVAGMTLPLARDLAEHLIRVVAIAPGMFATPLLDGLPADAIESLGRQVPTRRSV